MRVWVDQDLCSGDGLCGDTVPAVFTMGDDSFAHAVMPDGSLGNGQADTVLVPADLEQDVRAAASDCPTECIFVVD